MAEFKLVMPYEPSGDQPEAIAQLTEGVLRGERHQVLLGATGTGKTFTVANVIANTGRPTLVLSHNKTLQHNSSGNSRSCFQTTQSSTLSATTTTTSQKPMSPRQTPTSRKTPSSMSASTS